MARSRGNSELTSRTGSPPPAPSAGGTSSSCTGSGSPVRSPSYSNSFLSGLSSPNEHLPPNPGVEQLGERRGLFSRRGSSFTDAFGRIFQRAKRKKKPGKLVRDKSARPRQPDILDKEETSKLTKFWGSITRNPSEELQARSSPIVNQNNQLDVDAVSPFDSPFEQLATIPETPVQARTHHRKDAMDPSRLAPESLDGENKQRAIQDAKDMYQSVLRNCERTNFAVPPYDFVELIGKGAFGRVYKCRERSTGALVAIKIVNTDDVDYVQNSLDKDDTIRDFRKEVSILQQLKDSNAKNVNMIHDAFDLQEQLWIVSDYCTGGSVRTLMRAQPASHPGLDEKYIISIARELALAMKSVHDIGVIHRDIKCTNVYVTEEGEIQLGDFGIVGVMDDGVSKRRTMIGTPHYMPREMHIPGGGNQVAEAYGTEVDVWSYGCSVYEMATGQPPNAMKHSTSLDVVLINAPRLEGDNYSQGLREFVAYCLNSDPQERPTAEAILKHPFIASSQKKYPTKGLIDLIDQYKQWEMEGGWRHSLFFAGGAPPVSGVGDQSDQSNDQAFDDWNFSTSDSFNAAFEKRYSHMMAQRSSSAIQLDTAVNPHLVTINTTRDLTPFERIQQQYKDMSADRGERSLGRLWNPTTAPYELHTPVDDPEPSISDLPLRAFAGGAPTRESHVMIDLDSANDMDDVAPTFNFDFGDIPTMKARSSKPLNLHEEEEDDYQYGQTDEDREKRATMEWKFPTQKRATMDWTFPTREPKEPDEPGVAMELPPLGNGVEHPPGFRPTLKHTATAPVGQLRDFVHDTQPVGPQSSSPVRESVTSMIDLGLGLADPAEIVRPSTASSATGSVMTDATSGNPFDLEDDEEQNEIDRNRFSYHKQWQSEGGQVKRSSQRSIPMHTRGSSLSSTDDLDRPSNSDDDVFAYEYNRGVSESMRQQMNGRLINERASMDQWPDFATDSGFDKVRGYIDPIDELLDRRSELDASHPDAAQTNGYVLRRPNGVGDHRPELEFPRLVAPHPDTLVEGADENTVVLELGRLLDDFGDSLMAATRAFQQHGSLNLREESEPRNDGLGSNGGFP